MQVRELWRHVRCHRSCRPATEVPTNFGGDVGAASEKDYLAISGCKLRHAPSRCHASKSVAQTSSVPSKPGTRLITLGTVAGPPPNGPSCAVVKSADRRRRALMPATAQFDLRS